MSSSFKTKYQILGREQGMNSQYIKWYAEIEKELFSFFKLFDNLCSLCYQKTIEQVYLNNRKRRKLWCCCLIDNQVHGYWEYLNNIQKKYNGKWYDDLKKKSIVLERSMPGEGPCPALGCEGCLILHHRPLTCTTQLCEKMLFILKELNMVNFPYFSPLQIEDILNLPNIGEILYGIKSKSKKVLEVSVREYLNSLCLFKEKFKKIDKLEKYNAINRSIKLMEDMR